MHVFVTVTSSQGALKSPDRISFPEEGKVKGGSFSSAICHPGSLVTLTFLKEMHSTTMKPSSSFTPE